MTPSRFLLLLPLAMVFALQGCKLNVIDRPEQVEEDATFELRFDISGENDSPADDLTSCLSLPVGWSIESARYTLDGVETEADLASDVTPYREANDPRDGFAWHCFRGPLRGKNVGATIRVPPGSAGVHRLASWSRDGRAREKSAEFDVFVATSPTRYGFWTLARARMDDAAAAPTFAAAVFTNDRHLVFVWDGPGMAQTALASDDGFNWSKWSSGELFAVRDLVATGDRVVAVTTTGIHVSDDLETWVHTHDSSQLQRVTQGLNGKLFAVGSTGSSLLAISSDGGDTWLETTSEIDITGVACTDAACLAYHNSEAALRSEDGVTWTALTLPDHTDSLVASDEVFIHRQADTIRFSSDGLTWSEATAPFDPPATHDDLYLFLHGGRTLVGTTKGRLSWSDDGTTWNERRAGTGATVRSIIGRPELAVLVTLDGGILLNESGALAITTARHLPAARNEAFSRQFRTVGNHKPHTVTLVGGTLPKGLSLENGELTGTPEESGDFTYVLRVTDANDGSVDDTFHLHVEAAAPELSGGALPAAGAGLPYSATITAVNGASPLTWSHDGTLPEGLSFAQDGDTYVLSGTTEDLGSHTFDVAVTDRLGRATDATYTLLVEDRPSITTDAQLPFGVVGRSYQEAITAEGGTPPYTWSYDGALPPGLALTAAPQEGVGAGEGEDEGENENVIDAFYLAGIPTAAGSWTFENVTVTDANGVSTSADFTFEVVDAPSFATKAQLPKGVVGKPYQTFIIADGGTHPLVWSYDGALPDGLTLTQNSSWYVLSGTPTTPGSYTLADVTVTDANGGWARRTFTLEVVDAPTITTDELPAGEVGAQYAAIITAEGGEDPYTWTLPKNVPAGLTVSVVDGNVNVTGIPEEAGSFELTFTVSDANDAETVRTYTLVIAPEEEDEEPEPTDPGDDEPTDPQPGNDSGCGCSGTSPAGLALLAALAFTLRRRPILLG